MTESFGKVLYSFDVKNGVVDVKLPELADGDYNYVITYFGDSKYSSFTNTGNMKVNNTKPKETKQTPEITISPLNNLSADGTVTITLPSDATGNITLTINGNDYLFAIVNGKANVLIPNLGDGNYPYTITYSGDDKYSSVIRTGSLNVNKPSADSTPTNPSTATKPVTKITLTLKKVTVKRSAKKLTIQATLKINGKAGNGKYIKFKFNKKTYKAKTNAKGVAKITVKKTVLKKLKVGKKITYTATYGKITKKVTVKVKK